MSNYKIKKGNHYHSNLQERMLFFTNKKSRFDVTFGDMCWYRRESIPGTADDGDKNKLHGLRFINDHKNSAAFVWRPNFDNTGFIDIFLFFFRRI